MLEDAHFQQNHGYIEVDAQHQLQPDQSARHSLKTALQRTLRV
jgi:hypothetical protein